MYGLHGGHFVCRELSSIEGWTGVQKGRSPGVPDKSSLGFLEQNDQTSVKVELTYWTSFVRSFLSTLYVLTVLPTIRQPTWSHPVCHLTPVSPNSFEGCQARKGSFHESEELHLSDWKHTMKYFYCVFQPLTGANKVSDIVNHLYILCLQ